MSSRSTFPSADPAVARVSNLLGAWALAVSDRIGAATAAEGGRSGQAPAALVALHQFARGSTIEDLRQVLGLSHSAAVRLIDGLVADGHVARERGAEDRRAVALSLTASGRAAARRIIAARQRAIEATLEHLTEADLRLDERDRGATPAGGWLCRLCDFRACGRSVGRCPAAVSAARHKP
jgi:MarR family transcriptional repressor of emrRAB